MTASRKPGAGPITPLSFHILLALADGAKHGYGMIKEMVETTDGAMKPATGTVYLALQRLLDEGLIREADPPASETDERRKYYGLTPSGRRAASHEAQRMAALLGTAMHKRLVTGTVIEKLGDTQ